MAKKNPQPEPAPVKANGQVPSEVPAKEAIRQAIEALGGIRIDVSLAPAQMAELAVCYEDVASAQVAYTAKADAAKVAKQSLESVTALLLEKVREFTHPTPLPPFDTQHAEADRTAMVTA